MDICGHQKIVSSLRKIIQNNHLGHAYLFIGPPKIGKKLIAQNFAKEAICKKIVTNKKEVCRKIDQKAFSDVLVFENDSTIKINDIREIQREMSFTPMNSPYKFLILDNAENLTEPAANSLLKFLEEPQKSVVIILITSNLDTILPTIVSRCVKIKFLPVSQGEMTKYFSLDLNAKKFKYILSAIMLSHGHPGQVIEWIKSPESFQEKMEEIRGIAKFFSHQSDLKEKFQKVSEFSEDRFMAQVFLNELTLICQSVLLKKVATAKDGKKDLFSFLAENCSLEQIRIIFQKINYYKTLLLRNINTKLILENLALDLCEK